MESISNTNKNMSITYDCFVLVHELRGLFIDDWKIHRLPNVAKYIC
jgi:hypothetical protein